MTQPHNNNGFNAMLVTNPSRRRAIRITYDDGDTQDTEINGTIPEILEYYIGTRFSYWTGTNGEAQHTCVSVEFLS